MKITDLTVEVRDASLNRLGQLLPEDLIGFEAVLRFNDVGTWKISLPVGHAMANELRMPGAGLIVTTDQGTLLSGPTTSVVTVQSTTDLTGTLEISGLDDSLLLNERLAYPTPTTDDVTQQIDGYDVRTGAAEDVLKAYVGANIGPSAPSSRKVSNLVVQPSLSRGSTVTGQGRFQSLQELLAGLASLSNLGFTIEQVGSNLEFQVFEPVDRSSDIRLDIYNGLLTKTEYAYSRPRATHTIVAGGGDGADRLLVLHTNPGSIEAAAEWNRRIEVFTDKRGTNDVTALAQAGEELLLAEGKTIVSSSVSPSDDQTMRFGVDWNLGDKVAVVIDDIESSAVVTEVGIVVGADGVRVGATIGSTTGIDVESKLIANQQSQADRISNLERNEPALVATTVKQLVNNRTGATLTKGQAVYISGAQGNRVTVALAKADAESTSSKTFAIVEADIPNNQSGYVITEGSLLGLNTNAFAEGAALWLSPTVAGGWGTTKPSAPNHLVLVGFVERSQAVNGAVFVKIQNGFELEELHNVKITAPTDGQFLKYQASTGLWINSN